MPNVQVGNEIVEFPDSMSDEQIAAALQSYQAPAQAEQPDAQEPMAWGDVASQAVSNIPSSAAAYGGAIVEAVSNPLKTAQTIVDLGAGALQEILPESVVQAIGEEPRSRALAQRVGGMLVSRYGDVESAKRTIAQDPVGVLGDLSSVLGLGSLAVPGRAGKALRAGAAATEPLQIAARTAGAAAPAVGRGLAAAAGVTSGTGSKPIQEAYKAGRAGGDVAQQFRANITGSVPQQEVLDIAKNALNTIRQNRSRDYVSGMKEAGAAVEPIAFDGIYKAVDQAKDRTRFKDEITDTGAAEAVSKVSDDIAKWSELDPGQYHNALGMDALKRKIGATLEALDPKTNAYSAVKQIYDSVKTEIVRQAPKYAETMKQYQEMSDLILEVERSLSLGHKAAADTTMRKLQSLMRDNVQTNYGQRVKLGELLESYGDKAMMPALAGQTLSDLAPRGIAKAGAPIATYQALMAGGVPQALMTAAAASPRAVGETAYYAGRGAGAVDRIPAGLMDAITDPVYRNLIYQAQQGSQ